MAKQFKEILPMSTPTPGAGWWLNAASVPAKTVYDLTQKKVAMHGFLIEFSGQYDQSGAAEVQATEGHLVLISEVHLVLDGVIRRAFPYPVLYELNRWSTENIPYQVDPAPGAGVAKQFASRLYFPMKMPRHQRELAPALSGGVTMRDIGSSTLLDLNNYKSVQLEIVWNAFNYYVSAGGGQANMQVNLLRVTALELPGKRIASNNQRHFELLPITQDMSQTINDKEVQLMAYPSDKKLRGLLMRVGTLATPPIVTSLTSLTNLGLRGTRHNGGPDVIVNKLPVATHQGLTSWQAGNITLRPGYVWMDVDDDERETNMLNTLDYDSLIAWMDIVGTPNTQAQIYQFVRNA